MMKLLVMAALVAAPQVARADGWIRCTPPDQQQRCNASGADSASVGVGLALIAGVAYGIGRRKRR